MQVTVEYATGQVHALDLLPDKVSRHTMISVFTTGAQMSRLFSTSELQAVCAQLGLPRPKTKALAVAAILKLTGNPST